MQSPENTTQNLLTLPPLKHTLANNPQPLLNPTKSDTPNPDTLTLNPKP